MDEPLTPPTPPYPRHKAMITRLVMGVINAAIWGALLWSLLQVFYILVPVSWAVMPLALGTPALHQALELAIRLLLAVPLLLGLLLAFHPVRTRWWLVRRIVRLGRWLWVLARRAAPAPTAPAGADPGRAATLDPAPAAIADLAASAPGLPAAPAQGSIVAPAAPASADPTSIADPGQPAPDPATAPAGQMGGLQRLISSARPPQPMSRRRFLIEGGLFGAVVANAMFIEPYSLRVEHVDIPLPNLPERFVGMRIAQMSDLHVNGGYTTRADVERAVALINEQRPDMVLLTGDFVDWEARFAADATWPFRELRAPDGVYSVLGNHDYYSGDIARVRQTIEGAGLGLLVNQHTTLRRGADTLTIIGLDDPRHNRGGRNRASDASIAGGLALLNGLASPPGPRLLMVHNPILVPLLVQNYDLDLIVCGHTHGGQFQVPILTDTLVKEAEYFVKGRYDLGRTQLYINRGFGFTGPPVRFRVPPEITLLRLVRA